MPVPLPAGLLPLDVALYPPPPTGHIRQAPRNVLRPPRAAKSAGVVDLLDSDDDDKKKAGAGVSRSGDGCPRALPLGLALPAPLPAVIAPLATPGVISTERPFTKRLVYEASCGLASLRLLARKLSTSCTKCGATCCPVFTGTKVRILAP